MWEHTMDINMLKLLISDLPGKMPVFVGCRGYSNYDFKENEPTGGTDTFAIVHDGKLFITDECAIDIGDGKTI